MQKQTIIGHKIALLQLLHFAQKFGFFLKKLIASLILLMLLRPISHFLSASLSFFTALTDSAYIMYVKAMGLKVGLNTKIT